MKDNPCPGRQDRPGVVLRFELEDVEGKGLMALGKLLRKRLRSAPVQVETDRCTAERGHPGPCRFQLPLGGV